MKIAATALTLLAVLSAPALAETNQAATRFFQNWDQNADGTVTIDEAVAMRGDVFTSFDANEDGIIDAEEHVIFDQARANDIDEVTQSGPKAIIVMIANGMSREMNDADGNGQVTRDEFVAGAARWLASVDKNGDGVVTIADFGPGN